MTIHLSLCWPESDFGCLPTTTTEWRCGEDVCLEPRVVDALWAAVEPQLSAREPDRHPLGCHRRRLCDRGVFEAIVFRLVTGCSWSVAARLGKGGATTLRTRYNDWNRDGVFDRAAEEALAGYDRIIGLDTADVSAPASLHKAPSGGEGTGPNPCDSAESGWKWSLACDGRGIPLGWAAAGTNRHDAALLEPTLDAVEARGLLEEIGTLYLDRGYDSAAVRRLCARKGIDDVDCPPQRPRSGPPGPLSGHRWASAGSSSAPTRGCRTSGSYAAPPANASASSPWPSPSSSPSNSSN